MEVRANGQADIKADKKPVIWSGESFQIGRQIGKWVDRYKNMQRGRKIDSQLVG
jgi:hypothetical protein